MSHPTALEKEKSLPGGAAHPQLSLTEATLTDLCSFLFFLSLQNKNINRNTRINCKNKYAKMLLKKQPV